MLVMGFWHGVTWYYVAYGLFHGLGLVINDAWLRKKKTINKERKAKGLEPLPDNRWTQALGIFITFNTVRKKHSGIPTIVLYPSLVPANGCDLTSSTQQY